MLSFNNLGNFGRIGNQMFQYASLKGIAKNHGYDFCIPPREVFGVFDKNVKNDKANIYDLFSLEDTNNIQITSNKVLKEKVFHFDQDLFDNCDDDVDFLGYYQTEKYFNHIKDEILSDFTFKDEILLDCKSFYNEHFINDKVISLHIRRGDYITNSNHPVQSIDYYENALSNFSNDIPVLIFSDDPKWCENQKLFESDRFFISHGGDPIADLCMMTLCDYHIIANSSYSWWGAWLSQSEKVIAPSEWFGGELKKTKDTKDIYCDNWEII